MTTTEPPVVSPASGDAPYLSMRRPQVLDAAMRMLALGGDRAMTYRTVDAAAGVPAGTTSNHFRTRAALLRGAARHIERHRMRAWDNLLERHEPANARQLAKVLRVYLTDAASDTGRVGTLARAHTALLPLAASHPEVAELLAASRRHHIRALRDRLGAINSAAPPRLAALITDYLTGTLAHHHATGDTDTTGLTALTELLNHTAPARRSVR